MFTNYFSEVFEWIKFTYENVKKWFSKNQTMEYISTRSFEENICPPLLLLLVITPTITDNPRAQWPPQFLHKKAVLHRPIELFCSSVGFIFLSITFTLHYQMSQVSKTWGDIHNYCAIVQLKMSISLNMKGI